MSSLCGIRISQEDTQKLSGIVRKRMTALSLKDPIQYFQQSRSQWVLNEPIRKMGTFREGNIFADIFSLSALGIDDLGSIIYRNVFLLNPVLVSKSIFHLKARSFSPCGESVLCSHCG